MTAPGSGLGQEPPAQGLAARRQAVAALSHVLGAGKPLESLPARPVSAEPLEARDAALSRLIIATTLRRLGQLEDVLARFLSKPLPGEAVSARMILLSGAAQLLFVGTPAHAAIDLSVRLAREAAHSSRFSGLINAVLRKVAAEGPAIVAAQDGPRLDTPPWLWKRWQRAYGPDTGRAIAEANLCEAALDITVKADAKGWAERLGGLVLPTGTVRLKSKGRIDDLPGFAEGAWWVQDAAAALPARLLDPGPGSRIADLCAAPGGKTAQLAAAGAVVTAVDRSERRLAALGRNLARLGLTAETVAADAVSWRPAQAFDAILLDAPCLATGTIRRHPDLPHLKRESDLAGLAETQALLLEAALTMLRPGGRLVYCTCSLEPEEGPQQISRLLDRHKDIAVLPIAAGENGIEAAWLTPEGFLRTLSFHLRREPAELSGLDGFFAARLVKHD